ncbi:MAG: N-acetylmuramoyl-L-alanine amidase [Beijerinckiaceae bacterium]|nr:N-acetylmuramoyl-L-alanine amidase [Beijerinckiaceae bacterium]
MRAKTDSPVAAKVFASPNHGERKGGRQPDSVILHYTGMGSAEGALKWLCNPVSEVSCHYFVFEDGRVLQLVPEARRAWHAGKGSWQGETDMNSASIGIEIVNPGHDGGYPDFPKVQIEAVVDLVADIAARWRMRPERILAHSDIAPRRKADPGEKFPWARLATLGIGHWVEPAPIEGGRFFSLGDAGQPIEALQALFGVYGYGLEVSGSYDEETQAVVRAFQRHFRPERVDGVADASTIKTLHALVRSVGKD